MIKYISSLIYAANEIISCSTNFRTVWTFKRFWKEVVYSQARTELCPKGASYLMNEGNCCSDHKTKMNRIKSKLYVESINNKSSQFGIGWKKTDSFFYIFTFVKDLSIYHIDAKRHGTSTVHEYRLPKGWWGEYKFDSYVIYSVRF